MAHWRINTIGVYGRECSNCAEFKLWEEFSTAKKERTGKASQCRACMKAWRKLNKKAISKARKERYDADPKKFNNRCKAWREANKEKIREANKKYREENKEKLAAKAKAYREKNKAASAKRNKEWREANKETLKEKE